MFLREAWGGHFPDGYILQKKKKKKKKKDNL